MKPVPVFSTAKLDRILDNQLLQIEQERQSLLKKILTWLDNRGAQYGIQKAYIFGSITQHGRFNQQSDIDIAVDNINPNDFFAVISLISEATGRDVDVIEINKCHFADQIRRSGILWIATN